MIETFITFCGITIDSGNDIYRTMMKARKLSEGSRATVTVNNEGTEKTVDFLDGKPYNGF